MITEELWNLREQRLSMGSMDLGALEKGDLNDSQGVVLVVVDVSQNTFNSAVVWALRNVARKGDVLRIVGVLTHILNPRKFNQQPKAYRVLWYRIAVYHSCTAQENAYSS